MPYTTLVAGTTITASWANANVRDQVVTPFATAAARTSAITSPVEGMVSYRTDSDVVEAYDGSAYRIVANAAGFTSFSPTWSATGSAPSIGNGTFVAQWRYLDWKLIVAEYIITFGTTTGAGTGSAYFISLPQTAASASRGGGSWHALDFGNQEYGGATKLEDTTKFRMVLSGGGTVSATTPFAFASTDTLRAQVFYEPA